ncbi:GNAT family N-acetyltransferase [Microlunatus elymi]|uniref:GNAT family N-acetyltransferase n=1 Tax=Microlunatus elymi TaxID=2596828 RepID=A0A516Q2S9_9ACTN|nr:GNAT family N-acetyltransferase [Microlunatus elymi]QDP97692.1 GNAT family N-acetyltransferase [Microlunatus elymi]
MTDLLQVYDAEVRGSFLNRLPPGWTGTSDGPLARCLTDRGGFAMFVDDATALSGEDLRGLVDRTFAFFQDQQRPFEWKTFDHDRDDLRPLLIERGARPGPHEALVLGETALLATDAEPPDGVIIREARQRTDLERIAAMETEVWSEDWSWLADDLQARLRADEPITVLVAEDGDDLVSAAWLVPLPGTRVAGLWGGSTQSSHRGRGIYRALVARRARLALDRGYTILQVDASDDSRPILERLGLRTVGGTVPYLAG